MVIHTTPDGFKRVSLRLAPGDIEEALARCGFMVLNDAEEVSDADRAELARIEAQGYAESVAHYEPGAALAWWKARVIAA